MLRSSLRRRLGLVAAVALATLPVTTWLDTDAAAVISRTAAMVGQALAIDQLAASALARSSGEDVLVAGLTTASSQTFARPDGSFRLEVASGPVRVRKAGSWVPIDTTLVDQAGVLRPRAAIDDLRISNGGSGPFAQLRTDAGPYGLSWPGPLPRPTVAGDTATYRDVWPHADLTVTALKSGFAHSIVLRERPTKPVEIRLGLVGAAGVRLATTPGTGELRLQHGSRVLARAPAPLMWDASVDPRTGESQRSARVGTAIEQHADGQTLVLRPDPAYLTNPAVEYPVVVDPTTTLYPSGDTWIQYDDYLSSQTGSTELKAGTYNGSEKARSFLKFSVGTLVGKDILDADLTLFSYYASSCSTAGDGLEVRRLTSSWDSGLTWSSQPSTTTSGAKVNGQRHGYNSSCPADYMTWDVDTIVQAWANGSSNHGVRIAAVEETDIYSWTRFRSANYVSGDNHPVEPHLTVSYNSPPVSPTSVNLSATPGGSCSTNSTNPPLINVTGPLLKAVLKDADDTLGARFEWYLGTTLKGSKNISPVTNSTISNGYAFTATVTSGHFADGQIIKWRARGDDGTAVSGWSPYCYLKIDTSVPPPPIVTSPQYPEDGAWHDGVGRWGNFDFAKGGATNVAGYEYTFPGETAVFVAASTPADPARIVWTPMVDGPHTLQVRSKNSAGTYSTSTSFTFNVNAGTEPVAFWRLDDVGGTATGVPDGCVATCPDATLAAGATWTSAGRVDGALSLDGSTTDYANTSTPVVSTGDSYAVTAWVKLQDNTHYGTVVGQTGANTGPFDVYYSQNLNRWTFEAAVSDTSGATYTRLSSNAPPSVGVWTHLAVMFDNGANQLRMYVNGVEQTSKPAYDSWLTAVGGFQIGRKFLNGSYIETFDGSIDEVRVYDRVLPPDEVSQILTSAATLKSHWSFDAGTGTTAANNVAGGQAATLRSGAGWAMPPGLWGNSNLLLGAAGQYADTTSGVLTTDDSYSVMAWARASVAPVGTDRPTVVSQFGSRNSAFRIEARLDAVGLARWAVVMHSSDTSGGDGATPVWWTDALVDQFGGWQHLTLTYDALLGKVTVYVNGVCSLWDPVSQVTAAVCVAQPVPAMFNATGPVNVGRGRSATSTAGSTWLGEIDEVRLYSGVVSPTEIGQRQTSA